MEGVECVWIPGIDHAGIATQVVVEKILWKEKHQTRHDVGRIAFEEKIWEWKEEKAQTIGYIKTKRLMLILLNSFCRETVAASRSVARLVA